LAGQDPVEFTNAITFDGSKTTLLQKIEPRFGTRLGGDKVRFSGTNFDADKSKYTIKIDGVDCPVSAATTTYVECTTGRKDQLDQSSLSIFIEGKGYISNDDL
jgi:hypothetical protein